MHESLQMVKNYVSKFLLFFSDCIHKTATALLAATVVISRI